MYVDSNSVSSDSFELHVASNFFSRRGVKSKYGKHLENVTGVGVCVMLSCNS